MSFKDFYLNEMLVIGNKGDKKYIVAFDKWIYILEDEPNESVFLDIIKKLGLDEKDDFDNLAKNFEFEDTYSFITNIGEYKNDVLIGQINGTNLYLYNYGSFKLDPKSSVLVNKVIKQLGLKSASYIEDIDSTETKISKKKMTMQIPDIAYHGTSSKFLYSIMSKGLRPGEEDTNYAKQEIYHEDIIFFATRIGEAMHHAVHTANVKGGTPIILEFQIPDKDLIIADYDVEKQTGTDMYYRDTGYYKSTTTTYKKDPFKLSKEYGVYGYKGNIKPVFIKYIYVGLKKEVYNIQSDFKKMKPKSALRYLEMMDY